ncbi:hypothetical protein BDA99DRAFT_432178, partial [Phascolomyces articulosus]
LNNHKTRSISLSRKDYPILIQPLRQTGFPPCHFGNEIDSLIFLGYPLIKSKKQLDIFFR